MEKTNWHCPLCIASLVHPKDDDRKPVILFLDMDGVMYYDFPAVERKVETLLPKKFPSSKKLYCDFEWLIAKAECLIPEAVSNLNQLVEKIEASGKRALIVLSSTWRVDATLQQHREEAFHLHEFSRQLCGKTSACSGLEPISPEYKEGHRLVEHAMKTYAIDLHDKEDSIIYWLKDHGFDLEKTDYLVIDDHHLGDRFDWRLIKTRRIFEKKHLKIALERLGIKV